MISGKETIIRILIDRDEISREDAAEQYSATMGEVDAAITSGDFALAVDIFESDLGLESDYMIDALI